MLARLSAALADGAQRWVPDPFVIALGLTGLAFALGLVLGDGDVSALAGGWFTRFAHPGTLAFTTQMALILVGGATLARAPAVASLLGRLAALPGGTAGAAALTAAVAMAAGLINWGFGLVAGAVLARELGQRFQDAGKPLDYGLVGAAGYCGMLVWHGGFSGSAPLKVTEGTPGGGPPIGIGETLLSPLNLGLAAALLLIIPWVLARMVRPAAEAVPAVPARPAPPADDERRPLAGRLLALAVVALGALALAGRAGAAGRWWQAIGLDTVILGLFVLGLALYGTPQRFARAFTGSVSEAGGILLQFPFYFGILGVLEAAGLVELLANSSAGLARRLADLGLPLQWSFDMVTFLSAGLVNLFVPSGGGQWAVQGTIITEAAGELGLSVPRAVMALSYGDEWTNLAQPFWALALLGITGLKARDILGYTLTIMLVALAVFMVGFALL